MTAGPGSGDPDRRGRRSRDAGTADRRRWGDGTAAGRHGLARFAFAAVASLYVVGCLLVQVFLVGLDIFADTDASIHRDFAYVYGWLTPSSSCLPGSPRRRSRRAA